MPVINIDDYDLIEIDLLEAESLGYDQGDVGRFALQIDGQLHKWVSGLDEAKAVVATETGIAHVYAKQNTTAPGSPWTFSDADQED